MLRKPLFTTTPTLRTEQVNSTVYWNYKATEQALSIILSALVIRRKVINYFIGFFSQQDIQIYFLIT